MANMTNAGDLKERVEVWQSTQTVNDLGDHIDEMSLLRTIWASVTPSSGRRETIGLTTRPEISHKVICRESAMTDIRPDMYLMARSQKLKVEYWYPIYNRRGFMEIFCSEVIE